MKPLLVISLLLAALAVPAQQYSLEWYKVSGGGGTSTGGGYSVNGTIGQPDAGGAMTSGNYSLTGGFWSLITVMQTVGSPTLTVSHSGNGVIVSWPNTDRLILQQNSVLLRQACGGSKNAARA